MSFFENTQGEELQNSLWVEKYRPQVIDDIIVNDYIRMKINNIINDNSTDQFQFSQFCVCYHMLVMTLSF